MIIKSYPITVGRSKSFIVGHGPKQITLDLVFGNSELRGDALKTGSIIKLGEIVDCGVCVRYTWLQSVD